jgi:hypothetical protein
LERALTAPKPSPVDDVDASPAADRHESGEQAAAVFKLFAAGRQIEEIVILTRCPPSRVRALYLEFVTPLGHASNRRTALAIQWAALVGRLLVLMLMLGWFVMVGWGVCTLTRRIGGAP